MQLSSIAIKYTLTDIIVFDCLTFPIFPFRWVQLQSPTYNVRKFVQDGLKFIPDVNKNETETVNEDENFFNEFSLKQLYLAPNSGCF